MSSVVVTAAAAGRNLIQLSNGTAAMVALPEGVVVLVPLENPLRQIPTAATAVEGRFAYGPGDSEQRWTERAGRAEA